MLAALLLAALPSLVADMNPERVREALAWGASQKESPSWYRLKGPRVAMFCTPYARVAGIGYEAKREYRSVDETTIEAKMLEPYVDVYAAPQSGQSRYARGGAGVVSVRAIVVTSRDGANPIQPIQEKPSIETFGNALGARWDARSLVARFPLDIVRADREVHVIYDDGEDITFRFDMDRVR